MEVKEKNLVKVFKRKLDLLVLLFGGFLFRLCLKIFLRFV